MSYKCIVCEAEQYVKAYAIQDVSFGTEGSWDYVNCKSCHHGSIFPIPDSEALRTLYETLYAAEKGDEMIKIGKSRFDVWLQKRRAKMLSDSVEKPPERILDAGCGMGFSLKTLSEQFETAHCLGVELSPHAAEYARSLGGIEVQQVDFHSVEHAEYDVITFNHIIEHLSDPNDTLAYAQSLLAHDGRVLIEVPTSTGWALSVWKSFWWCHLPPQHLHLFSPEGLEQLMNRHGFEKCAMASAAYPMPFTMGWIVFVRAKWGSFSPYKDQMWVRLCAFLGGLFVLPFMCLLDLILSPLLNRWKGDIVTMVFKKKVNAC